MLSGKMKINTKKSDNRGKTGAPRKEEMCKGTRAPVFHSASWRTICLQKYVYVHLK